MVRKLTTNISFPIDSIFLVILQDMILLKLLQCICDSSLLPLNQKHLTISSLTQCWNEIKLICGVVTNCLACVASIFYILFLIITILLLIFTIATFIILLFIVNLESHAFLLLLISLSWCVDIWTYLGLIVRLVIMAIILSLCLTIIIFLLFFNIVVHC